MGAFDQVVFDCARAPALARFWASVLDGYRVRAYDDAEIARLAKLGFTPETDPVVLVDGPGPSLCFQQVATAAAKRAGAGAKRGNIHLDLSVGDRAREVERLRALGAEVVREASDYTVMRDPEGNRFCVVRKP
ncbi:MAG: VOC family protein [Myxococcota bacterium]